MILLDSMSMCIPSAEELEDRKRSQRKLRSGVLESEKHEPKFFFHTPEKKNSISGDEVPSESPKRRKPAT